MSYDLTDIAGIGSATADKIKAAGIDSIEKLATIKPEDLVKLKIKGVGKTTAQKYINNAKKLLEESGLKGEPKYEAKPISEIKPKPKPKAKVKPSNIKELMKKQAECNIGLVGHVDHGKTTLVKALTGDWTDRHSEEQERGISIKLGYSNATILYCPNCDQFITYFLAEKEREKGQSRFLCPHCKEQLEFRRNISFVDAPGHEILMATMLSGASLMDGACLLISADEQCPQPQTREHLAALDIAGIKNLIILQNKIDAVSREQALENYQQIKEFVKGTVAENSIIIPISAVFGANMDLVIRAFEEIIPSPQLSEGDFQFLIARSFDINRPGIDIKDLKGGVIGGSVLKGRINIGDQIEIRPGLRVKDDYFPIKSTVISISQGNNLLDHAKPRGLIGLGTKLDPSLTKGDHLIGHLVGKPGSLPEVLHEVELEVSLLDRVIGSEQMLRVHSLKHNEKLLLVVGTEKTGGTVTKILKDSVIIKLNPPICPPENFIYAISRIINRRYRLIGYGKTKNHY
ncbi:MAG: translation initiation factor IF-2 subunit gamma [Promethearchaeota archaeon]|nr:MAG: translation initiation factor IF-2 subunit gamma [Candidatus Lokiarchaeota archaeon]